jgi:hypothetical protein
VVETCVQVSVCGTVHRVQLYTLFTLAYHIFLLSSSQVAEVPV